jgi:predicted amidohydrolase
MPTLDITIVQADLHWHDASANREKFDSALAAIDAKTDLVVLPEMFTTGFSMDAPKRCTAILSTGCGVGPLKNQPQSVGV